MPRTGAKLRIGELSRRTGVPPSVLRTWEQRYAVLRPERTSGGLRLFSPADETRILAMRAHMRSGLSAAEAARAALAGESPTRRGRPEDSSAPGGPSPIDGGGAQASELAAGATALARALASLDRRLADEAIDRLLGVATLETVASRVLLPYLAELGARWQRGEEAIAEEHFATQVLRGRLLSLAHRAPLVSGPRAVLACPPLERHDIALVILAAALERRGWDVALLGADTPVTSVRAAAGGLGADVVVISAVDEGHLAAVAAELRTLGRGHRLLLAGPGASARIARRIGALRLAGDPVSAARELAEMHAGTAPEAQSGREPEPQAR